VYQMKRCNPAKKPNSDCVFLSGSTRSFSTHIIARVGIHNLNRLMFEKFPLDGAAKIMRLACCTQAPVGREKGLNPRGGGAECGLHFASSTECNRSQRRKKFQALVLAPNHQLKLMSTIIALENTDFAVFVT